MAFKRVHNESLRYRRVENFSLEKKRETMELCFDAPVVEAKKMFVF